MLTHFVAEVDARTTGRNVGECATPTRNSCGGRPRLHHRRVARPDQWVWACNILRVMRVSPLTDRKSQHRRIATPEPSDVREEFIASGCHTMIWRAIWVSPSDGWAPCEEMNMVSNRGPFGGRRRQEAQPQVDDQASRERPVGLTLIRIDGSKIVHQCVAGFRMRIGSRELFDRYGYQWSWIEDVAKDDPLALLPVLNESAVGQGEPSSSPPFRTFDEYLALAMTNPNLIQAPFNKEEHRIMAFMRYLKADLVRRYRDLSQDQLVSVIVPTYERAHVVEAAIASVLQQSYRNLELVVVDDGSQDDTERVVTAIGDERLRYIKLPENRGHAHARNAGLQATTSEWIAYLDSDDTWDEHFLLIMVNELERQDAEFGYSAQLVIRPAVDGQDERRQIVRFAPFHRGLLENTNFISMISVLHRRALLDRVGGLDESMRRYVDWEFFLRLSAASPPAAIPIILSSYDQSVSPTNVSRGEDRQLHLDLITRSLRQGNELAVHLPALAQDLDIAEIVDVAFHVSGAVEPVSDAPGTTIIIPSYEAQLFLRACVESIRQFTPAGVRIVIIDNASGPQVQEYLDSLEGADEIVIIRNETNHGFTYAVNQGIEAAGPADDIVLMNNDALVTPGWLEGLQRVAQGCDDVGIVAPRQVLPAGTPTIKTHVPGATGDRECDTNLSAHHRNVVDPFLVRSRGWVELNYAPFFCVLITRRALDRCGPLDHINAPHYHSDRVYCDAVRLHAGLKIVYTPESKVYHFHERATHDLRRTDGDGSRL